MYRRSKINSLIFFANLSLLTTNIWIILYTSLIDFLNFKFPARTDEIFYRPGAAFKEPFEMLLYILITFLFVLAIWLFRKKIIEIQSTLPNSLNALFLPLLFVIFITKLGGFPLANQIFPYSLRPNGVIYSIIALSYLITITLIITQSAIIERFAKNKKIFSIFFSISIIFIIAAFTFEPRFPISAHEYGYFFAPVWDVVSGKTLFTDIHTDYGFYSTLFFATLYKMGIFQFQQLPIYVWFMFIAQYFLSFYLIYKISKSVILSLIGLFSIITVNYFSAHVLPITITQYSAMRRLPSILLLFLLYKFKKIDWRILLSISLIDFWIVDTGISILLAFGLSLFTLFLSKLISLKRFIKNILLLVAFQGGIFLLINIFHYFGGYKPINYMDLLASLRQHAGSGLTMLPIEFHNFFWVTILIYFSSIIYFFRNNSTTNNNSRIIILFSANLSFFNALYFVGRSHPANLVDISILVILNAFLLISVFWQNIQSTKIKFLILPLLFIIFIVFPARQGRYHLTEFIIEKIERASHGNIFKPETAEILNKEFSKEKKLISGNLTDNEILVLSKEETYLLMLTGKKDLLDVNPQSGVDTVAEMDFAIKRAVAKCPQKIAVDCRVLKKCPDYESYSQKSWFMAPVILDAVEKKCQLRYQASICTDKICIARGKK